MVKIIENYALHEQIGEGEYGKVYRGVDSKTGKNVAVKVINAKKFKNNPKLQECTLNEIEVLSKIDSPYIVRFLEILKTANNFYFFYEYCNSGTLDKEIKAKGVLQQKQVLAYLYQILEGFKILSSKSIMHRDLKPENILIHNGQIKLGDFGFCKSLQNSRDLAQTMLGSPIYMAPEVLKGEIYTVKADIWSLGVVVYEMLFGFCPFEERSIAKLINILDTQQLSFNSEVNRVSPILQELVRKMLVKDHFKRISWDQIFQYVISNGVISKFRPSFTHCDSFYDRKPLECRVNEQPIREQQKMFKKKSDSAKKPKGDSSEVSHALHKKLTQCVRLVYEFLQWNTDWEFAGELASRLYQIILKEHYRLTNRVEFIRERAEISQLIRVLQQDSRDTSLLLERYIQFIRNASPAQFTEQMSSKKTIISCIKLLDFNDMRLGPTQYELMDNDRLVTQFNAKLPLNAI